MGYLVLITILIREIGDDEPEPLNAMAILAGIISIGAAGTSANPAAAGVLGGMAGIASIIGEAYKDESNVPDLAATQAGLESGLDLVCKSTKDRIMNVLEAVMGVPGFSEADIPWEMTKKNGEDTGYVHANSYLFGNGQWLLDHPTDGLSNTFDDLELHMVRFKLLRDTQTPSR